MKSFVNYIKESENWSDDVKSKWTPEEGLFTKDNADYIKSKLLKGADNDKALAMKRLMFYINRAGDKLTNKTVLNKVKGMLKEDMTTPMNTMGMGNPSLPTETNPGSGDLFDYQGDANSKPGDTIQSILSDLGLSVLYNLVNDLWENPKTNDIKSGVLYVLNQITKENLEDEGLPEKLYYKIRTVIKDNQ
jgi:hypothetical protein